MTGKQHFLLRLCDCLLRFLFYSRILHSYGDVSITGESLQILLYTVLIAIEHWGSLTWHSYCDIRYLLVISKDPWHIHKAERLAVEMSLTVLMSDVRRG